MPRRARPSGAALQHEGGLARVDVQNAAVAHGVTYLTSEMQPLLDTLGVTPARASAMVTARLGTLLAGDPSVTAGAPSQTPVPVTIPAPPPVHVCAAAGAGTANPRTNPMISTRRGLLGTTPVIALAACTASQETT